MRYLITLIWAFLISMALGYVLPSMAGEPFSITPVFALTVIFAIIIAIIGDGILKDAKEE